MLESLLKKRHLHCANSGSGRLHRVWVRKEATRNQILRSIPTFGRGIRRAAIDTFNWLENPIWPDPDADTKRFILVQLITSPDIRTEDERRRFVAGFVDRLKELKIHKVVF